jgi:diguanylate cyclase (GGDEF)-like protein
MFGMRAGDEVIARVGATLEAAAQEMPGVRPLSGREAGGKFLILAPGSSLEQAKELAEVARLRVAQLALDGALREASLTLSAGIAQAPRDGKDWRPLLRRAESALSTAKKAGRDRVATAPQHTSDQFPVPGASPMAMRDTRASGLWAPSGLWDPKIARGLSQSTQDDESSAAIAPLILTHAGQSILGLVAQALGSDLEPDALLSLILGIIADKVGARRGYAMLREPNGPLRMRAAVNRETPGARSRESAISQGIVREVERLRSAVLVADAMADDRFRERQSIVTEGIRSVIAAPILWGEEVVGILYLDNKSVVDRFGQEDRDLLLACGRLIAGPVRRTLLHQARGDELEKARARLARSTESEILHRQRYSNIIGESAAMKAMFRLMDRLLDSGHPVLIHGESGTGKELVASAIHYNGSRRQHAFIAENCAALSDTLLEAELFGHVKGAFTGANNDRVGLIEAADKGTLFLDEIGEMSERMQAKLLRVLQEGEVRPVGGREVRKVDVRVIAASNRDLMQMVREGTFREDLYYRIAVMTLDVPPLRERREDIPRLVDHFLTHGASEEGRTAPEVDKQALQLLVHYDWPGNVRELENEIKKLLTLAPDRVLPQHVSPKFFAGTTVDRPQSALRRLAVGDGADAMLLMIERGKGIAQVIEEFEKEIITRVLKAADGNRSETARRLSLSRPGLLKKMKRYGIS